MSETTQKRDRPMDDPALRSAPAGRIESAAAIVVHAHRCDLALDQCGICGPLYQRADDQPQMGGFDLAVADLAVALQSQEAGE